MFDGIAWGCSSPPFFDIRKSLPLPDESHELRIVFCVQIKVPSTVIF